MAEQLKEKYSVKLDGLDFEVDIKLVDKELRYYLALPVFEQPTRVFMNMLRDRLAPGMESSIHSQKLRENLSKKIGSWIDAEAPNIGKETRDNLVVSVLNKSLGMGDIEFLLKDPSLEEIVVNSNEEPVRVYHKKYGWLPTNLNIESDEEVQNYAKLVAREIGKEITINVPLMDAHLLTGDRINAVLTPISDKGTTLTIRMFARDPWTFPDFVKSKTVTPEILALLWTAIQYEMNILISGGTGSGKTSLLNILMPFIQPNHRVISVEDTREIQLPHFLYWCPMKTRSPNPEGEGEITMSDLIVNALRMRPDRIILGEIRKGKDAEILFEAMHTGHSVYSTLHADTSYQTLKRLTNAPINVPATMLESIHLNAVMYRDRRSNIRRVYQLAEVIPEETVGGESVVKANVLYRWKARNDEIVRAADDVRIFQEINMHTGLSRSEVNEELKRKEKIINWFVDKGVRKLEDIGTIMRAYYLDSEDVLKVVDKNQGPEKILA